MNARFSPSRLRQPHLAASNAKAMQRFFVNQTTMAGLLADLSYPIHGFVAQDLALGLSLPEARYHAKHFTKEYLLNPALKFPARQRTGLVLDLKGKLEMPRLTPDALEHLASMIHRLDGQRDEAQYPDARRAFTQQFLAAFSYAVALAIQPFISRLPVTDGCPLSAQAHRATVLELEQLYEENLALTNQLILANIGLVRAEARRVQASQGGHFDDLVSWGMTGLQDGIYRFAPGHRNRAGMVAVQTELSSAAVHWIRYHIERSQQHHGHTIAVPVMVQKLRADAQRVALDTKMADPNALAEAMLLRRRAKGRPWLAARLQADAETVLARYRKTEQWSDAVCTLRGHVAEATSLPCTESVDFDFECQMRALESRLQKAGQAFHLVAADTYQATNKEGALEKVFAAMQGMHPNSRVALSLGFGLPNAYEAGLDYLRGIIEQSHARTEAMEQERLQRERRRAGDGAVARVFILDGMDAPVSDDDESIQRDP